MAGWARILGFGKKLVNNSATRSLGGAVVHPQRTLAGLGHATKTAVVGGGMGYLAWENIVNDKPVVRTVADVLVGEGAVDKGMEMAGEAAEKVEQAVDRAGEALQRGKGGRFYHEPDMGRHRNILRQPDRWERLGYVRQFLLQLGERKRVGLGNARLGGFRLVGVRTFRLVRQDRRPPARHDDDWQQLQGGTDATSNTKPGRSAGTAGRKEKIN